MRVVELFAGAGGLSLGLTQAGLSVVRAYEREPAMRRIYVKNMRRMPHLPTFGSIAKFADAARFPELVDEILGQRPDLIAGGPPCQDYSAAGKRIEGERARLTAYYAQLICIVRPQWFLLENVEGALGAQQYAAAKRLFRNAGYGLSENVLVASRYGTPQRRPRLILIGRVGEEDGFLDSALLAAATPKEMSIRDAFGDRFGSGVYFHPKDYARKAVWSTSEPAPTIRSASHKNQPAFVHRPEVDDPIEGDWYNPNLLEMPLFHGFPEWWDWSGETKTSLATMIGNVVPPPLARAIGKCILARHEGRSIPALHDCFSDWLLERGYTAPSVRNVRSRVNAARRVLQGKTFANPTHEIGALEAALEVTDMSVSKKSDIRSALRLHRAFTDDSKKLAAIERKALQDKQKGKAAVDFDEIRAEHATTYGSIRRVPRSYEEPEPHDDGRPDPEDVFKTIIEETA
ncbi:DNA cytosine methyltransferase [Rhizobium sp. 268]|uniref:DNA cytosine methyltransferase n=1 Tax=Rhizobium sp. 268 TaxID=2996375 RepID=UPI002F936F99